MSNNYVAKEWDITSVPTAADFNHIEQGIRAITPQLLWQGDVDDPVAYKTGDVIHLREPVTNFQRLQFFRGMYATYTTNQESHILRVEGSTQFVLGGCFRANSDTSLTVYAMMQTFARTNATTLTMTLAKRLNQYGTSTAHTATFDIAAMGITAVYGLDRIAG